MISASEGPESAKHVIQSAPRAADISNYSMIPNPGERSLRALALASGVGSKDKRDGALFGK